jgi:hypothetical protein
MHRIFLIFIVLFLTGCAPSLEEQQALFNDREMALVVCQGKNLQTLTAKVTCMNDGTLAAYRAHKFPYMDLVESVTQRNLIIAHQADAGQIAMSAGANMILENEKELDQQINARNLDDARRRAAFAAALASVGQNIQRQEELRQQKQLNCTSTAVGNTVNTNCY